MASAAIFSSLRRRSSPSLEAFLAPVDLPNDAVLEVLRAVSTELASSFSGKNKKVPFFQGKNSRSLIRKIQIISVLVDALCDVGLSRIAPTVFVCLKELYLLLYRSKILIDHVSGSSKVWLLLQNHSISGHFHDINQEISTLFDVFPLTEINLSEDVKELIDLLRKQARTSKLSIDRHDDLMRLKLFHFLNEFENGRIPEMNELYIFIVERLGICNVKSCRTEIEFLEEQIVNHDGDLEPSTSILNGFVALMRYSRFLLFPFEDEDGELGKWKRMTTKRGLITREIAHTFVTIPKDFCCPISLELMHNPVIVSTGQTYDCTSIARWLEEGHNTCPKTGQMLVHTRLLPNFALRNLILQWCMANEIPYDPPENTECSSSLTAPPSKAAVKATKATAALLVGQLANGTPRAKTVAAWEIRLLAKTGRENRAYIAEAGAIPLLKALLPSSYAFAQENSVTALLNLSIYDKNKSRIMDVEGCLGAIVGVLRYGHTTEARENSAATLFSLSAVHDYKKQIAKEDGAVEALARMLADGTARGKKDAVTALFNLSTHPENCSRMIESEAVQALVGALECEIISEEAAGALALIVRQPLGAEAVGKEESTVVGLTRMMRSGSPRAKENAVATLLELCKSGGTAATEKVLKAPAMASLLQSLLFTGTKRARRKAASLARVFQRCDNTSLRLGGLGLGYAFARGDTVASRDTSFGLDVSMPVSISVSVL